MGAETKHITAPSKNNKPLIIGAAVGITVFTLVILLGLWVTNNRQSSLLLQQTSPQEKQAQVLEAAALDQLDAGHSQVAVDMLTEVINLTPARSEAYYYRAVAYSNLNQFEQALPDFDIAVGANAHWALPLTGRAAANLALGNTDEAISDFDKAINLEPGEAALYANRGQVYHQLGNLEQARDDFNMAVQFNPDLVAARFNRGVLLYALGKNDEAIEDFTHAIAIEPTQAPPYFNRGIIYFELDQTNAAKTDLQTFITLSDNPELAQVAQNVLDSINNAE